MKIGHTFKISVIILFAAVVFTAPLYGQEAGHLSEIWGEFTDIPRSRGDRCRDIVGIFRNITAKIAAPPYYTR